MKSILEYLEYIEQRYGNLTAIEWHDDAEQLQAKTYREFVRDVTGFAKRLKTVDPLFAGKHVGIFTQNTYESAVCIFAVMAAQGVAVLLNGREYFQLIRSQIELADVSCILLGEAYLQSHPEFSMFGALMLDVEAVSNADPKAELAESDLSQLATIYFTSGTTGKSKAVMISYKNLFVQHEEMNQLFNQLSSDKREQVRFGNVSPLYHIAGFALLLKYILIGYKFGFIQDAKNLYRDLKNYGTMQINVTPTVLAMWKRDLERGRRDRLGEVTNVIVGGATVDAASFRIFKENGITVSQVYAMTENFNPITLNPGTDPAKIKSVGKAVSGNELKIIDGEICVKGDAVMMGYYKDPEATAEAIQDGWLHTGDLGYIDEDGYVYLTGRKKNLIILASGENVSPEELEGLLLKNEAVKEVLVKEKNEKICAEIFCDAAVQDEIRAFVTEVNRKLPFYKRMTLVEFRAEPFERTSSGKIKRN